MEMEIGKQHSLHMQIAVRRRLNQPSYQHQSILLFVGASASARLGSACSTQHTHTTKINKTQTIRKCCISLCESNGWFFFPILLLLTTYADGIENQTAKPEMSGLSRHDYINIGFAFDRLPFIIVINFHARLSFHARVRAKRLLTLFESSFSQHSDSNNCSNRKAITSHRIDSTVHNRTQILCSQSDFFFPVKNFHDLLQSTSHIS